MTLSSICARQVCSTLFCEIHCYGRFFLTSIANILVSPSYVVLICFFFNIDFFRIQTCSFCEIYQNEVTIFRMTLLVHWLCHVELPTVNSGADEFGNSHFLPTMKPCFVCQIWIIVICPAKSSKDQRNSAQRDKRLAAVTDLPFIPVFRSDISRGAFPLPQWLIFPKNSPSNAAAHPRNFRESHSAIARYLSTFAQSLTVLKSHLWLVILVNQRHIFLLHGRW